MFRHLWFEIFDPICVDHKHANTILMYLHTHILTRTRSENRHDVDAADPIET